MNFYPQMYGQQQQPMPYNPMAGTPVQLPPMGDVIPTDYAFAAQQQPMQQPVQQAPMYQPPAMAPITPPQIPAPIMAMAAQQGKNNPDPLGAAQQMLGGQEQMQTSRQSPAAPARRPNRKTRLAMSRCQNGLAIQCISHRSPTISATRGDCISRR